MSSASGRGKKQVTGHWINGEAVLPDSSMSGAERRYLLHTNMNITHDSMEHFRVRARNWDESVVEDWETLGRTGMDLQNHETDVFQQSSHMAHIQRGDIFSRREAQKLLITGDQYDALVDSDLRRVTISRRQGDLAEFNPYRAQEYDNLMDMMVSGKQGPLTKVQSQMGVEATVAGHKILKTVRDEESGGLYSGSRVGAKGRVGHPSKTATGVDLSGDVDSVYRDSAGLPVKMGTSGSSSDMVISHQAAVKQVQSVAPAGVDPTAYAAPGLSELPAERASIKLAHRWMRLGAPSQGVKKGIDKQLNSGNQVRVSSGQLHMTQTHTLDEISVAVRNTRSNSAKPSSKL